jgi:hypothetical protein
MKFFCTLMPGVKLYFILNEAGGMTPVTNLAVGGGASIFCLKLEPKLMF